MSAPALGVLLSSVLAATGSTVADPAHFVILLSDDTGWWNMGWNNDCSGECGDTPFMDSQVKSGLRLDQHYAYRYCSPTRSSLMTGRLPIHVNQQNNAGWGWTAAAVHPKFTMLPEKLASRNYVSHQIGKWHLGLAKQAFTPVGRGFNSSLGYLGGAEDHYHHTASGGVDLWASDHSADGYDGVYSANMYADHATSLIASHPKEQGLFMYVAFSVTHEPIEAPDSYVDKYPETIPSCRRIYNGMASAVDDAAKNITAALHSSGLWNSTLVIWSSDNGGPSLVPGPSCANNYPMRGGKGNDFQGGVRVAAWVNGGLLPDSVRGSTIQSLIHVADWYATICGLANVDPHDSSAATAGLPGLDSIDQWPILSQGGAGVAAGSGPRKSLVTGYTCGFTPCNTWGDATLGPVSAALLDSDGYKLVYGNGAGFLSLGGTPGIWYSKDYPNNTVGPNSGMTAKPCGTHVNVNGSHVPDANRSLAECVNAPGGQGCPSGCLFHIFDDPTEHRDLSATMGARKAEMMGRLRAVGSTVFQSDTNASYPENLGVHDTSGDWKSESGFVVPWLN